MIKYPYDIFTCFKKAQITQSPHSFLHKVSNSYKGVSSCSDGGWASGCSRNLCANSGRTYYWRVIFGQDVTTQGQCIWRLIKSATRKGNVVWPNRANAPQRGLVPKKRYISLYAFDT